MISVSISLVVVRRNVHQNLVLVSRVQLARLLVAQVEGNPERRKHSPAGSKFWRKVVTKRERVSCGSSVREVSAGWQAGRELSLAPLRASL